MIAKQLTYGASVPELNLLQGTADILILRTLAWEPMHGYAIAQFVRTRSSGAITIDSAALYQSLHRLQQRKLVRSWWGLSDTNRRARFYELTPAGRQQLREQSREFKAYFAAFNAMLEGK